MGLRRVQVTNPELPLLIAPTLPHRSGAPLRPFSPSFPVCPLSHAMNDIGRFSGRGTGKARVASVAPSREAVGFLATPQRSRRVALE